MAGQLRNSEAVLWQTAITHGCNGGFVMTVQFAAAMTMVAWRKLRVMAKNSGQTVFFPEMGLVS
ncbi:putative ankyrin repeat and SOCS box protein 1 [Sesbania bispinosa]|nr:putative ankyrin repeat and SOCS box protein 1 [Sesbania bispinosa]